MATLGYKLSSEEFGPRELVRFARQAEDSGFAFALISDHFHPWTDAQGHSPFVWSVIGALAEATSRLAVGTGVTCPTMRTHPVVIAQAAATSAVMLPGRFFLGLGTGLGTCMIIDGTIAPLELGHLPYRKGLTFEQYVGVRGLKDRGKRRWREAVFDVVARLKDAMQVDYVVLGGGNVKNLDQLPEGARRGDNRNAFLGGFRLWNRDVVVSLPQD